MLRDAAARFTRFATRARTWLTLVHHSAPARRALARRGAAAAVAMSLMLWTRGQLDAAGELRRRWDATEVVVVTTEEVALGEPLDDSNTRTQRRPPAFVPAGAVSEPLDGRRARSALEEGEVVVSSRVGEGGGVAAEVPPGWAALSLRLDGEPPQLRAGDRVQVVAPGEVVGSDAIVLTPPAGHGDPLGGPGQVSVTVAVPESDVGPVTAAALTGPVALALLGTAEG